MEGTVYFTVNSMPSMNDLGRMISILSWTFRSDMMVHMAQTDMTAVLSRAISASDQIRVLLVVLSLVQHTRDISASI